MMASTPFPQESLAELQPGDLFNGPLAIEEIKEVPLKSGQTAFRVLFTDGRDSLPAWVWPQQAEVRETLRNSLGVHVLGTIRQPKMNTDTPIYLEIVSAHPLEEDHAVIQALEARQRLEQYGESLSRKSQVRLRAQALGLRVIEGGACKT